MAFQFTDSSMNEFKRWEAKFPSDPDGKRSLVIPGLWISQKQNGFINNDVVDYVAQISGTDPMHVWGVATFYTMFNKEKTGKHVLEFCSNITCTILGGEELMHKTCKKLGINPGETTADGQFTVREVECLGACGESPTMQIDQERYMVHITENDINQLIDSLRKS